MDHLLIRFVNGGGPKQTRGQMVAAYRPLRVRAKDENGLNMDGYYLYYICFHISVRIWIRIRIVSTIPDMIRLDIGIINMRFEYSDTDTVSDVGYLDLIRTYLNPSKRIRFQIRSENIHTVFILNKKVCP